MNQVWLQRRLDEAVMDEQVEEAYEEIKINTEEGIPPLEDIRVKIEQQLRQDANAGIEENLR